MLSFGGCRFLWKWGSSVYQRLCGHVFGKCYFIVLRPRSQGAFRSIALGDGTAGKHICVQCHSPQCLPAFSGLMDEVVRSLVALFSGVLKHQVLDGIVLLLVAKHMQCADVLMLNLDVWILRVQLSRLVGHT